METITLEEIQSTKLRGFLNYKDNQVFLNLEDKSKKLLVCNCGSKKFVKEGLLLRCLSCNNIKLVIIKEG